MHFYNENRLLKTPNITILQIPHRSIFWLNNNKGNHNVDVS